MDGEPAHSSGLRAIADRAFESYSPYTGVGFLNHNLRLYELSRRVMDVDGLEFDDDLLYAICMFHDLGLVAPRDQTEGDNYMLRSLSLLRRQTKGLQLQTSPAN